MKYGAIFQKGVSHYILANTFKTFEQCNIPVRNCKIVLLKHIFAIFPIPNIGKVWH